MALSINATDLCPRPDIAVDGIHMLHNMCFKRGCKFWKQAGIHSIFQLSQKLHDLQCVVNLTVGHRRNCDGFSAGNGAWRNGGCAADARLDCVRAVDHGFQGLKVLDDLHWRGVGGEGRAWEALLLGKAVCVVIGRCRLARLGPSADAWLWLILCVVACLAVLVRSSLGGRCADDEANIACSSTCW